MKRAIIVIVWLLSTAVFGGCNSNSGLNDLKSTDTESDTGTDTGTDTGPGEDVLHSTFGVTAGGGVVSSENHRARVIIGGMPMQTVSSEQHRAKIGLGAPLQP
jgi:predicted small secreted protein